MRIQTSLFCAWISLAPLAVGAQETEVHDHEPEKKNEVGLFAGGLTNLEAKETGPSIGAEYIRELTHIIGIGVMGEFAKAGEREALVAGTLVVKAGDNFKVVLAPGVIIEKKEEEHGGDSHDAETSLEGSSRETSFRHPDRSRLQFRAFQCRPDTDRIFRSSRGIGRRRGRSLGLRC